MPEPAGGSQPDAVGRVVAALHGLERDLDGIGIAELLWLAAGWRDRPPDRGGVSPVGSGERETRAEFSRPPPVAHRRELPVHGHTGAAETEDRAREIVVPRASALPGARRIATALRPLGRPWPAGRGLRLDIGATVADYARSGELVPAFVSAPERWFDLAVVVDRTPTMRVWDDTVSELLKLLTRSGVFRTVRVSGTDLGGTGENTRPGPGARLPGPSGDVRRLVLVVSDCVPGRTGGQLLWERLHQWAGAGPTLLVNPLPQEKWRLSGLDLPAVRVTRPSPPGLHGSRLRFTRPPVLDALPPIGGPPAPDDWLPVPVVGLSARAVHRWARTVMRGDPAGCPAVLVPAPGVFRRLPPQPPADGAHAVESFVQRASDPALSLAVLCSSFSRLNPALLHLVRQELVPDATTADVAEIVTGGLVDVAAGAMDRSGPVLVFRPGAREALARRLGVRDRLRTRETVSRWIAARPAALSTFHALVPDPAGDRGIAGDSTPFAAVPAHRPAPLDRPGPGPEAAAAREPRRPMPRLPLFRRRMAATEHQPYFFLSYARTPRMLPGGPDPDMWVERLFRDLWDHVAAMTDLPGRSPAGFMDREVRSGEGWSAGVAEALATCRVFVPLYSPRYFASELCGKEWSAFARRAAYGRAGSDRPAEAIVPALWVPMQPAELPVPAERIQYNHRAFGDRYVTDGLYGLIKLRIFAEEYEAAVYELAKRIVTVADTTRVAPAFPADCWSAPSAFGTPTGGPRPLKLTVAAPTRHDLPAGRVPDYYGKRPQDWNPYHPRSVRPIASVAQDLLRSLNYRATVSSLEEETLPRSGQPPTQPEILLVDRWTLADDNRCARLAAFAAEPRPWVTVVTPWNRDDPQSRTSEAELDERLERIIPGQRQTGRVTGRDVLSMEAFGRILPQVVEWTVNEYLRHAVARPPAPGEALARPPRALHHTGEAPGGGESEE
ncbi:TIR-like protein FxsC [Streptomyces sp. NPDC003691]